MLSAEMHFDVGARGALSSNRDLVRISRSSEPLSFPTASELSIMTSKARTQKVFLSPVPASDHSIVEAGKVKRQATVYDAVAGNNTHIPSPALAYTY